MNICLFTPQEIRQPLPRKDERAEHLIKILHKKEGDSFTAGVIEGKAGQAVITSISNSEIIFDFKAESDGKPLNPLLMIIGFPRPIQLKRLLRDVAALGVEEIHLTGTELGEKSYMKSKLVEKGSANKMLLDGSVQAGSTFIPKLYLHQNLNQCLEFLDSKEIKTKIALDNKNPSSSLSAALVNAKTLLAAAIGSERGWTDNERKLLESKGYIRCGMGDRIMRTETAATVAGAIILNNLGYLQ